MSGTRYVDSNSADPPSNDQEHGDTQRSLRQASVALEVAYNRIRQVRRSLLLLSESVPISDSRQRMPYNEFRPNHRAIMLSGEFDLLNERQNANSNENSSMLLPRQNGTLPLESSTVTESDLRNAIITSQSSSSPPSFSGSTVLPPRFSRRDVGIPLSAFQRRGTDSASTTRGLRVTAREASSRDTASSNSNPTFVEQSEYDARPRQSVTPDSENITQSSASESFRRGAPPDQHYRRMRPDLRGNGRRFNLDSSERLQSLRPSHSPVSTIRSFQTEPPWYLLSDRETEQFRLYQEAARADDMFNNLNTDWSNDEFLSWLFSFQNSSVQRSQDVARQNDINSVEFRRAGASGNPLETSRSRRGWARLDADGNEISVSEEEELERSRSERRLPLRQYGMGLQTSSRSIEALEDMHTMLDSVLNIEQDPDTTNSDLSEIFYVDPLPMPLASMITKPKVLVLGRHADVVVPKNACLAGR